MRQKPANWVLGATFALSVLSPGCSQRDTGSLALAPPNNDPVVFTDEFGSGVEFQAFGNSFLEALAVDTGVTYEGGASIRITVPADGAGYAGGAFTTTLRRDLSSFNALTFWAKASEATTLDVAGLGNDNTGTSLYTAETKGFELTVDWNKYVVPFPLPAKLEDEGGLFFFADAADSGAAGHTIWFDDIVFESLPDVSNPRPSMRAQDVETFPGLSLPIQEIQVTFNVGGTDQVVGHLPGYWDFTSSDETVATVSNGVIDAIGSGVAVVSATMGGLDVAGTVTVRSAVPDPTSPAPTRRRPPTR